MKLAFFSSSPLAMLLLQKLKDDFEVVLTVTTKEKMDADFAQKIKELKIDLAVVIDYGLLIPKIVFAAPKLQTINIHFSLLPKYRGANPDSFVILNKEKTTGISFVLIDEGFDTGDILAQKEVTIFPNETAGELHQRLYQETEKIISYIIKLWGDYKMGKNREQFSISNLQCSINLPPKKQNNKLATYTKRLGREDGYVSWKKLLEADFSIYNFYRSVTPWPGLWTKIDIPQKTDSDKDTGISKKRLKILKCHLENNQFIIDQVQLEGKKPVSWKQFKEAYLTHFS